MSGISEIAWPPGREEPKSGASGSKLYRPDERDELLMQGSGRRLSFPLLNMSGVVGSIPARPSTRLLGLGDAPGKAVQLSAKCA